MNPDERENELLAQEVHKLQHDIRFMKRWGAIAAAGLIVLILAFRAADRHRVTTQQIVARDFVLIDSDGRARVRVAVFPEGSGMESYAASGERRVQLVGDGELAALNLNIPVTAVRESAAVNLLRNNVLLSSLRSGLSGTLLEMHSQPSNGAVVLRLEGTSASLMMSGTAEDVPKIWLNATPSEACTAMTGVSNSSAGSSLCLHSPGLPSLELNDTAGNRAVIGIPQSPDLSADRSSAALLILKQRSGKKVKVAPEPQ